MTYGWYWIAVIAIALILEIFTRRLVSVWFILGSMVAIVLDLFSVYLPVQIAVLIAVSILGIFLLRKLIVKNSASTANIDSIIGERCVVTEKVDNYAGCGQVKIKGQSWSARGVGDDDVFEVGTVLHVVALEGVKVICRK